MMEEKAQQLLRSICGRWAVDERNYCNHYSLHGTAISSCPMSKKCMSSMRLIDVSDVAHQVTYLLGKVPGPQSTNTLLRAHGSWNAGNSLVLEIFRLWLIYVNTYKTSLKTPPGARMYGCMLWH